jgi:hypothetical protein
LSTTSPTCSNLGHRGGKSETNRLSYSVVLSDAVLWSLTALLSKQTLTLGDHIV